MDKLTAKRFRDALGAIGEKVESAIPKREIFALAKEYRSMPVVEVVKLLKDNDADLRLSAVSILDWKARDKKTSSDEREDIYRAYLDHHRYIDDWGMVDRAAPYVVGGYLFGRDKKDLYDLAKSQNPMERRTAIVSTYFFIRQNDVADTFGIAELLVYDSEEVVQKAVGSWVREAGKRDEKRLIVFLTRHAKKMPRVMLRFAIEKLDQKTKAHFMGLKSSSV